MSSQQIAVQEVEKKHAVMIQYSTVQYSTVQYSEKINIEKKRLFNPTHLISRLFYYFNITFCNCCDECMQCICNNILCAGEGENGVKPLTTMFDFDLVIVIY